MSHLINVIDLEATCFGNFNDKEISEVIEIGICIVDTKHLEIKAIDSIIVKPTHTLVSEYCTNLTTLTQAIVNCGFPFRDACNTLRKKYASKHRTFASWGNYDRKQFKRQCLREHVSYPFNDSHINIKNLFKYSMKLDKEVDMVNALNIMNMHSIGTIHRGVDDAYNISVIFIEMLRKLQS